MCFDYDDHAELYDQKSVKTRKPHRCEGCNRMIAKGETADRCSGLFDHHWFKYYVCLRCQRMILSIVAEELQEGCRWNEAWCAPADLKEYLSDRHKPVQILGMRTVADCRRYVDDLWCRMVGIPTVDMMM